MGIVLMRPCRGASLISPSSHLRNSAQRGLVALDGELVDVIFPLPDLVRCRRRGRPSPPCTMASRVCRGTGDHAALAVLGQRDRAFQAPVQRASGWRCMRPASSR